MPVRNDKRGWYLGISPGIYFPSLTKRVYYLVINESVKVVVRPGRFSQGVGVKIYRELGARVVVSRIKGKIQVAAVPVTVPVCCF